jgi:hypothetical protein
MTMKRDVVLDPGVVQRDDVRVVDLGRRPRLLQEALADLRVIEELRLDHLEGDDAVELELARSVDDAHPSASDRRLDPMAGEERAGGQQAHGACISELAPASGISCYSRGKPRRDPR